LADPPATYEPAKALASDQSSADASKTSDPTTAKVVPVSQSNSAASPQTQTATLTAPAKKDEVDGPNDPAMPQPKAPSTASLSEAAASPKMDVAGALKSIVSPTTNVTGTAASAKQDATVSPVFEQLAAKSDKIDSSAKPNESASGLVELSLSPEQGEMRVGEKRQLALAVKTGAPLGLAVVTLRFDPHVVKVNAVTAGSLFANAKTAPALTQSIDQNGMLLVSLVPAAGSSVNGEGTLLNIEFEAIATGDSLVAFDLANVHLVASDGRNLLLQVEPVKLMVK
jgi:Cohesin domain